MASNVITPAYDDALRQFADRLPVTNSAGTAPRLGSDLLAEFPEMKDVDGAPLDPDKRYYVKARGTATNHLRRLRKAYEMGGQAAVVKYLQPYAAFLEQ